MTTSAVDAVKQVFKVETAGPTSKDSSGLSMNAVDDLDDSKSMLGVVWRGKKSVEVVKRPVPKITDPVSMRLHIYRCRPALRTRIASKSIQSI